jgi:hypothetical protein
MSLNNLKKLIPLEQSGSVNDLLAKRNPKIAANEGNGYYQLIEKSSTSQVPNVYSRMDLDIPLTTNDLDIIEFHKSFVNMKLEMELIFDGGLPILDNQGKPDWCTSETCDELKTAGFIDLWDQNPLLSDIAKHQYIFVGFKNSTDAIGEMKVVWESTGIEDTLTSSYQINSFAINAIKPQSEKNNKKNIFSLWENVHEFNQSACGVYISYYDLYKQFLSYSNKITVQFYITIDFDNILHFLNFEEYPRFLFGNLSLRVNIVPNALVWCCVDPKASIRESASNFFPTTGNNIALFNQVADVVSPHINYSVYDKRFIQLNSPGRAITNIYATLDTHGDDKVPFVKFASYGYKDLTLKCEKIDVRQMSCYLYGYDLKDLYKKSCLDYYTNNQWIIPAENIVQQTFSNSPTNVGLNVTTTFNLKNAKAIAFLFPETGTDLTVFKNPFLSDLTLTINSRNIPSIKMDTTSPEFLKYSLEAAGLDTIFTCTESFENSISEIDGFTYPIRGATYGDNTDFIFMVPLERSSASPFYFDGYNGSGTDTVKLTGVFLSQRDPRPDISSSLSVPVNNYSILNRYEKEPGQPDPNNPSYTYQTKINNTFPMVLIISNSYWVFQVGKQPKYYSNNRTWMDILETDYNPKFQQLSQQVRNALSNQ